jgi:TctA family transporter
LYFAEAVSLVIWYCFVGASFSAATVGVLPGLGSLIAISLLAAHHLSPAAGALIMLAGVYFGADYGGGTCSYWLGVPGRGEAR